MQNAVHFHSIRALALNMNANIMSEFSDLIYPTTVRAKLLVDTKKAVLNQAGHIAASALGLDSAEVTEGLIERERLGSTGFGGGVALPHARIEGISGVRGIFLQLSRAIDFDSVDSVPVDLVFVMLSPIDAGAEHLKALARVSRYLRDENHLKQLRGAESAEALYTLLLGDMIGMKQRDAA
jgi:nitrogen PTS system EIIA component